MKPEQVTVSLNLPFGLGGISGTWAPDEAERKAAWEMYVELVTRVSVEDLPATEGLLREALSSVYTLFGSTREILRRYGPEVAAPRRGHALSFGTIAVTILNRALRPLLAEWHPELSHYESAKPPDVSAREHEARWERRDDLRRALADLRRTLRAYADLLAAVAGVPSLVPEAGDDPRGAAGV